MLGMHKFVLIVTKILEYLLSAWPEPRCTENLLVFENYQLPALVELVLGWEADKII